MGATPVPDRTAPPWTPAGWLLVAAAFAAGFVNFPLRVAGSNFEYLPGDAADNRLNNYVLEHGYRFLAGRADSFWDIPSFYPLRGVTAWSDTHLGLLPVYAAFRAGGLSPERAFQGWFLVPFVLNFAAAAWALRRLGAGPAGAAAGAYLFAFGLPLAGQLNHAQLFPRFLVPPAAAFGWEFLRTPRAWRLAVCAASVVGQIYLTVYVGVLLVLLLATGFAVAAVRFRRELPWRKLLRPDRRERAWRVAALAVAAVAVLPLGLKHGRGLGGLPAEQVRNMAPRPAAWVTPPNLAAAYHGLGDVTGLRPKGMGEQQLFLGLVPLAAVLAGLPLLVRPGAFGGRGSAVAVAAGVCVVLAVVVTPVGGVWLYEPVSRLPGAGGIRAMGRVVLVLLFPAAVAVAWGADGLVRLAGRRGRATRVVAALLALAAVVADQWLTSPAGPHAGDWEWARYPVERAVERQQRLIDAIRRHPSPALVYVFPSAARPDPHGPLELQVEALRAAQELGLPCANGWSGYLPSTWDYFAGYRGILGWLTEKNRTPPERLAGLVLVGEPVPDADAGYERRMRAAHPPQPVAPE